MSVEREAVSVDREAVSVEGEGCECEMEAVNEEREVESLHSQPTSPQSVMSHVRLFQQPTTALLEAVQLLTFSACITSLYLTVS